MHPRILITDLDDVTEKNIRALLWGPAFTVGALINSLLAAGVVYVLILLTYHRLRPGALAYFRRHARSHQQRFRQGRLNAGPRGV